MAESSQSSMCSGCCICIVAIVIIICFVFILAMLVYEDKLECWEDGLSGAWDDICEMLNSGGS